MLESYVLVCRAALTRASGTRRPLSTSEARRIASRDRTGRSRRPPQQTLPRRTAMVVRQRATAVRVVVFAIARHTFARRRHATVPVLAKPGSRSIARSERARPAAGSSTCSKVLAALQQRSDGARSGSAQAMRRLQRWQGQLSCRQRCTAARSGSRTAAIFAHAKRKRSAARAHSAGDDVRVRCRTRTWPSPIRAMRARSQRRRAALARKRRRLKHERRCVVDGAGSSFGAVRRQSWR